MHRFICCSIPISGSIPSFSAGIWEKNESLADGRLNFISPIINSTSDKERLNNVADCMLYILISAMKAKQAEGRPMDKVMLGITDTQTMDAINSIDGDNLAELSGVEGDTIKWIRILKDKLAVEIEVEFFRAASNQRSRAEDTMRSIIDTKTSSWRSGSTGLSLSDRKLYINTFVTDAKSFIRKNGFAPSFETRVIQRLGCLKLINQLEKPLSVRTDSPSKRRESSSVSRDVSMSPSKRSEERKPSSSKRPAPYPPRQPKPVTRMNTAETTAIWADAYKGMGKEPPSLERPKTPEPPKTPKRAPRNLEADGSPLHPSPGSWKSPSKTVYIRDVRRGYQGYSRTGETPESAKAEKLPPWATEKWRGNGKRK
ncbi:hypothetical protein CYLTODRAFT_449774 [Cylindrobasidium torrendii FP15055 ss-10]|uniref:Uncharacterized protein n=1 Tax=Cylindrobasidium torrendii FP15055 ss-10 TaxID=1314674 RepID=A0A0D7BSM9_9AGAR|nr:hypothetical protein CYLTODRAFT_449774 [Cylindrobasidium torrendii FP15055 ss-10]